MRPRAVAAVAVALVLLALAAPAPAVAPRGDEPAAVLRVVDGDTLQVQVRGRVEKVRLIGVDTPESVDPRRPVEYFGKEASAFTRRIVEGKNVILRGEPGRENRDRYGRLLRYVYLPDGTCLNAEIIRQGYGHAYVKYPFLRQEEFRAYEREAKEAGRGLWGTTRGSAQPVEEPPAASSRPRVTAPFPQSAPGPAAYVASARSDKYHMPSCPWARRIAPANLVAFGSAEEARASGRLPCSVCLSPISASRAGPP